ncbi:MAG: spore coat protein [Symbiobacteriaceae bacterium]|nr:spore coat protein [Symbiobacteriaceae bacterium]
MPLAEYHLKLDPADLRWFHDHPGTDRCFPAILETDTSACPVWIGYRGRYSRNFRKPSYDIWFGDKRLPDWGPELHLNAAYRDPSLMRGRLSFALFEKLSVAVPRCKHIWLAINEQNEGVYTAIEAVDRAWLQRQTLPDGPIYFAVGSKGNFGLIDQDLRRPKRYITAGYEKRHPDDDFTDLEELIEAITFPTALEFPSQIGRTIDVENCLRWLVGMEFVSHTDGIVQNYALYKSSAGQWRFSPWDLDGTWGRYPSGVASRADHMPVGTGEDNYLLVRLLRSERWRAQYIDIWRKALRTVFVPERLDEMIAEMYDEIRGDVVQDRWKRHSNTTFRREPERLRRYVRDRLAFVQSELGLSQRRGSFMK